MFENLQEEHDHVCCRPRRGVRHLADERFAHRRYDGPCNGHASNVGMFAKVRGSHESKKVIGDAAIQATHEHGQHDRYRQAPKEDLASSARVPENLAESLDS